MESPRMLRPNRTIADLRVASGSAISTKSVIGVATPEPECGWP